MSAHLIQNRYGKHRVRVSKVRRPRQLPPNQERHEFVEVAVDVELEGDFDAAFTEGDNQQVIATDTCKNTIYSIAKMDDLEAIETFGSTIAQHFIDRYQHVSACKVKLVETVWDRIGDSMHGFAARERSRPTSVVTLIRGKEVSLTSGIDGLLIAKTTESGFEDFHRDEYRTLSDVSDRILATELSADWKYGALGHGTADQFSKNRQAVMDALLAAFLDHYSRSVQETLFRMGQAALDACSSVEQIALTMPNKHHILANLVPKGTPNDNEVFVVTDEPYGFIQAKLSRN